MSVHVGTGLRRPVVKRRSAPALSHADLVHSRLLLLARATGECGGAKPIGSNFGASIRGRASDRDVAFDPIGRDGQSQGAREHVASTATRRVVPVRRLRRPRGGRGAEYSWTTSVY